MAKFATDAVLDGSLAVIETAVEMYVCEGQPTDRADAITRAAAGAITLDSGDFSIATSGAARVLTVAAQTVNADESRAVDHVALCTGSALLFVTTSPAQNANDGGEISVAAFDITASAPV